MTVALGVDVVGIDGTRGGWVAIALEKGRFASDYVLRPIESDFAELAEALIIAVDVPIGFGPRAADAAARAFLKGAASTVFTTPARDALERPFGPGLGVSAQAHALGPRIPPHHSTSGLRCSPVRGAPGSLVSRDERRIAAPAQEEVRWRCARANRPPPPARDRPDPLDDRCVSTARRRSRRSCGGMECEQDPPSSCVHPSRPTGGRWRSTRGDLVLTSLGQMRRHPPLVHPGRPEDRAPGPSSQSRRAKVSTPGGISPGAPSQPGRAVA